MLEAKRRAAIFLILAFILAAVAGFLILEKVKQLNSELGGMVEIYVANSGIPERTLINSSNLTVMEIPQKFLTESHITSEDEIVGQVSVVPLKKGDIITTNMLKGYSALQNENNRLVVIPYKDNIMFDQMLTAQDRVDLIVSLEDNGAKKTELFMKDVPVLYAVPTEDDNGLQMIGVEVSSEDATRLIHMQNYAEYIRVLKANVGQAGAPEEGANETQAAPAENTEATAQPQPETQSTPPPQDATQTNTEAPATSEGNS